MKKIMSAAAMKAADNDTIKEIGVPSAVLMERAAYEMAHTVIRHTKKTPVPVCVIAGSGNNGGDGYACGRILFLKGYPVTIYALSPEEKMSEDAKLERRIASRLRIPITETMPSFKDFPVLIDCIFGIGLNRPVSGHISEVMEEMNRSGAWILSADIASGISADTGAILGCAVRASKTVSMQYAKPGHYFYPGAEYTGTLTVADIGIYDYKPMDLSGEPASDAAIPILALEHRDIERMIPRRDPAGNKGTFGKVLLIAGTEGMAGASYLAAAAALRTGAGMVKVLLPEENRSILQTLLPEAILGVYHSAEEAKKLFHDSLAWANAIVIGPGMGNHGLTKMLVNEVLKGHEEIPCVIDADGLNSFEGDLSSLKEYPEHVFVTPHMAEMSRLTGKSIEALKKDPIGAARAFSSETKTTILLKDARTVIASPSGRTFLNLTGNDGMASAGSGDVLAGILGGLLARGTDPADAGSLAAFLHGTAGDHAADHLGKSFMTAGDIITGLRRLVP